jgi:murein DD-endopeptidase MepM/ murein hydrolase activator NlpD
MPADGKPEGSSDQDPARPGLAWTKLIMVWDRAREVGLLPRFALHICFLFVVLAGLLIGKAVTSDGPASQTAIPSKAPSVSPPLPDESRGGTGGEEADVLLYAVVPHTTIPRRYRVDPITYTVEPGDNVSTIAQQFGVSVETILWNNGSLEDNPDYLDLGDVLTILPVSGVYHAVGEGDTLESIAEQYKARVEDIIQCEGNYLQEPYTITVGQELIVPSGRKPYKVRHVVAWSGPIPQGAKRGTGIFGWPMSGWISQRYHEYHPAADIAGAAGTPVKAADSGYVALVGRNDTGYGRYVLIDHGNGFQTLYAHFNVIFVEVGQSVGKGQTIGLCGSTGKSTGPHVHFEIKLNGVRRNPLIYLK